MRSALASLALIGVALVALKLDGACLWSWRAVLAPFGIAALVLLGVVFAGLLLDGGR